MEEESNAPVLLIGEREAVARVDEGVEHDGRQVDVVWCSKVWVRLCER
jgi:hypothetical protein